MAVSSLSSAEQALFAIVRAVEDLGGASAGSRGRLLVLDEPTPFLPRVGVDQLFGLIRQVVAEGASVIFVSHDISEVMEITDRATVLRDGVLVDVLETRSASHDDFVERIVGRSVQLYRGRGMKAAERAPIARIVDLMAAGLGPVTLDCRQGRNRRLDRADRVRLRPGVRRGLRRGSRDAWRPRTRPRPVAPIDCAPLDRAAALDRCGRRLSSRRSPGSCGRWRTCRWSRTRCCRCSTACGDASASTGGG